MENTFSLLYLVDLRLGPKWVLAGKEGGGDDDAD